MIGRLIVSRYKCIQQAVVDLQILSVESPVPTTAGSFKFLPLQVSILNLFEEQRQKLTS